MRLLALILAFASACATTSHTIPTATAADAASIAAFFAALKANDPVKVEQLLAITPALAAAHRADGTSAVLAALSVRTGETFVSPQHNSMLASVLARHPALDPFEAAAVGDQQKVAAALAFDPTFIRAVHAPPIGWTLLHFAAFGGQLAVAEMLIARGADVNARAQTKFRNTPLQVALLTAQVDIARALVARGADVNVKQSEGITALHEAAFLGMEELMTLFLDAGADVNARANDGRTPLDIAVSANHSAAAALLRQRASDSGGGR